MSKKLFFILVILLILVGCTGNLIQKGSYPVEISPEYKHSELHYSSFDRKIIYNSSFDMECDNLENCINYVKSNLEEDEWLDSEYVSETNAYLTIRVKTERLDDYIEKLKQKFTINNFSQSANDISIYYQDRENLLLKYEAEYNRLLELYEEATISEMIHINTRISEIEIEMQKIQGELNNYNSLIDYSTIRLNIIPKTKTVFIPIGDRLFNALKEGFYSLVNFFDTLLIVLVTIIPWSIIIIPVGFGLYRYQKYLLKRRPNKTE